MKILSAIVLSALIPTAAIITGCHSYDVNGSRPVRYASGVQVRQYDFTQRSPSKHIEIFDQYHPVSGSYTEIAYLSHQGYLHDENLVENALVWRARQLGANGIILLPPGQGDTDPGIAFANQNGGFAIGESTQVIFRGIAIIVHGPWEQFQKPPTNPLSTSQTQEGIK